MYYDTVQKWAVVQEMPVEVKAVAEDRTEQNGQSTGARRTERNGIEQERNEIYTQASRG